ncbi:hypothetical protein ANN_11774 [Periplaneta americana]|uniref:RNase H type-1 domain-containing protein n=1 Tax=Periplaneta americana TaxID=6978 RepID=A0ABQ8T600_PERAM|nr:hypothetical protein ANN_11774 [Periplaneta americana]
MASDQGLYYSLRFPFGKRATVIQTEIYAIIQCVHENIRRAYSGKQILIFSDSQADLMAFYSHTVTSGLVLNCLNILSTLAEQNETKLIWVPGHCGIEGNEKVELVRQGATAKYIGPEPVLGISRCEK